MPQPYKADIGFRHTILRKSPIRGESHRLRPSSANRENPRRSSYIDFKREDLRHSQVIQGKKGTASHAGAIQQYVSYGQIFFCGVNDGIELPVGLLVMGA
jgi:hypothetical protein